jgi:hypothetical protein
MAEPDPDSPRGIVRELAVASRVYYARLSQNDEEDTPGRDWPKERQRLNRAIAAYLKRG